MLNVVIKHLAGAYGRYTLFTWSKQPRKSTSFIMIYIKSFGLEKEIRVKDTEKA